MGYLRILTFNLNLDNFDKCKANPYSIIRFRDVLCPYSINEPSFIMFLSRTPYCLNLIQHKTNFLFCFYIGGFSKKKLFRPILRASVRTYIRIEPDRFCRFDVVRLNALQYILCKLRVGFDSVSVSVLSIFISHILYVLVHNTHFTQYIVEIEKTFQIYYKRFFLSFIRLS